MSSPRLATQFLGHQEAEASVLKMLREDKLPHALILSGPEGIGKSTFAHRLARFLLWKKAPENPNTLDVPEALPHVRRMMAGSHGDFFCLEPGVDKNGELNDIIPIADVRKALAFLQKTPMEGGWRVVIIDSIDALNKSGANALLKFLEEPGKKVVFLLVSHHQQILLPTIRSRCQMLSFSPLPEEIFEQVMRIASGETAPSSTQRWITHMAEGSPGIAMKLKRLKGDQLYREMLGFVGSLVQGRPVPPKVLLESSWEKRVLWTSFFERIFMRIVDCHVSGLSQKEFLPEEWTLVQKVSPNQLESLSEAFLSIRRFVTQADILNIDNRQLFQGIMNCFYLSIQRGPHVS